MMDSKKGPKVSKKDSERLKRKILSEEDAQKRTSEILCQQNIKTK